MFCSHLFKINDCKAVLYFHEQDTIFFAYNMLKLPVSVDAYLTFSCKLIFTFHLEKCSRVICFWYLYIQYSTCFSLSHCFLTGCVVLRKSFFFLLPSPDASVVEPVWKWEKIFLPHIHLGRLVQQDIDIRAIYTYHPLLIHCLEDILNEDYVIKTFSIALDRIWRMVTANGDHIKHYVEANSNTYENNDEDIKVEQWHT